MFYSKTTNGFYDEEIHSLSQMPEDVVELSAEEHKQLLLGQENGQIITSNSNGFPVLEKQSEFTVEEKKNFCKKTAKFLLLNSDWSQYGDVAETLLNKSDFDAYRAVVRELLLRPIPNPTWPVEPVAVWKE